MTPKSGTRTGVQLLYGLADMKPRLAIKIGEEKPWELTDPRASSSTAAPASGIARYCSADLIWP
jgi:hypothetical protein